MLEQTMKDLNYDMKAFLKMIFNTQTYQAAAYTKDIELGEQYHFQGPVLRRMTAEQVWDSMVALYKPGADRPGKMQEIANEAQLRRIEWLDRALHALSTEELIEGAKKIADVQKRLAQDVREAQVKLQEASKNKDEAGVRAAKKVVSQQRKKIDEECEEIVYTLGWKKFAELAREGKLKEQTNDPEFAGEIATVLKTKTNGDGLTIDDALEIYNKQLRNKALAQRKAQDKELAERLKVDTKPERTAFEAWEQVRDSVAVRAADLKSPSPNGHFLREFGQSDRELVNNGSAEATVGQSLMLLNGKYFRSMMNPYTIIGRALSSSKDADTAIDNIYLATMARPATEDEKQVLREVIKNPNDMQQKGEALWSVINTRQFLFVQ
jgi:hypothetical protein